MDVNITTIAYLRVLIIGIGSTIILMVVEDQGLDIHFLSSRGVRCLDGMSLGSDIPNHSFGLRLHV